MFLFFLSFSFFAIAPSPSLFNSRWLQKKQPHFTNKPHNIIPLMPLQDSNTPFLKKVFQLVIDEIDFKKTVNLLYQSAKKMNRFHLYKMGIHSQDSFNTLFSTLQKHSCQSALFCLLLFRHPEYKKIFEHLIHSQSFIKVTGNYKNFSHFFKKTPLPYCRFLSETYIQKKNHELLPSSLHIDSTDSIDIICLKIIFSLLKAKSFQQAYPLKEMEHQFIFCIDWKEYIHHQIIQELIPNFCESIIHFPELSILQSKIFPLLSKSIIKQILDNSTHQKVFSYQPLYQHRWHLNLLLHHSFSTLISHFNTTHPCKKTEKTFLRYLAHCPPIDLHTIKKNLPSPSSSLTLYIILNFKPHDFSLKQRNQIKESKCKTQHQKYRQMWLNQTLHSSEEQFKTIVTSNNLLFKILFKKIQNKILKSFKKEPATPSQLNFLISNPSLILFLFSFPSDPLFKEEFNKTLSAQPEPEKFITDYLYKELSKLQKLTLLGRTIYGFNIQLKQWMAFKFQKENETKKDFIRAHSLHLIFPSFISQTTPQSYGIYKVHHIHRILPLLFPQHNPNKFDIFHKNNKKVSFFRIYTVNSHDFFLYPYTPLCSVQSIFKGLIHSVRLFATLWKKGYYLHSLAPLFHDKSNQRIFCPAILLLDNQKIGSLQNWDTQATDFPDIRVGGLMDLEDGLFEISEQLDLEYQKSIPCLEYKTLPPEQRNAFFKINSLINLLLLCELYLFRLHNERKTSLENLATVLRTCHTTVFETICELPPSTTNQILNNIDYLSYLQQAIQHTSPSSPLFQEMLSQNPDLQYLSGLTQGGYKKNPHSLSTNLGGFNSEFPITLFTDTTLYLICQLCIHLLPSQGKGTSNTPNFLEKRHTQSNLLKKTILNNG